VTTKLSTRLPKALEANGIGLIRAALLEDPEAQHVAVVVVDCCKITEDVDSGDRSPMVRVLRLEPVTDPDDAARLLEFMARQANERCPRPATEGENGPALFDVPGQPR